VVLDQELVSAERADRLFGEALRGN
jgi:hypothetical protein